LNFDSHPTSNSDFITSYASKQLMMKGIDYYLGLCAVCCATMTSGFAGVYNEKLMKDGKQLSLFIRSIQLSIYTFPYCTCRLMNAIKFYLFFKGIFSILFAVIGAAIKDGDRIYALGFFYGFDKLTWFIVVIQVNTLIMNETKL